MRRGLIRTLGVVGLLCGVIIGGGALVGGAAPSSTPPAIVYDASTLANQTTDVERTVTLPVEAQPNETITIGPTEAIPAPGDLAFRRAMTDQSGVTARLANRTSRVAGLDTVILTFNESVHGELSVTIQTSLDGQTAQHAVAYHNTPIWVVQNDTTASDLAGEPVQTLSVAAGAVSRLEVKTNATFASERGVYETPIERPTAVTATPVDQFGNNVGADQTTPAVNGTVTYEIQEDGLLWSDTIEKEINRGSTTVQLGKNKDTTPLIGGHTITVETSSGLSKKIDIDFYSNETTISASTSNIDSGDTTELTIDLGVEKRLIGELEVQFTSGKEKPGYIVSSQSSDFQFRSNESQQNRRVYGRYIQGEIRQDGIWKLNLTTTNLGRYNLTIDVMPHVTTDQNTTTNRIGFAAHGPVTQATLTSNRSLVGAVVDPRQTQLTIDDLADHTGIPVTTTDSTLTELTLNNTSLLQEAYPIENGQVGPLTVTTTAIPPTQTGNQSLTATFTHNGTTTQVQVGTLQVVHEVIVPPTVRGDWRSVSTPMAANTITYVNATTGPDGEPLEVRWNATAGTYQAIEPQGQPGAHWLVAGAAAVGITYRTAQPHHPSQTLDSGWHQLGPAVNLTARSQQPLATELSRLTTNATTVYHHGTEITDPHAQTIEPYETYWVHVPASTTRSVPAVAYQPANRSPRAGR